jgi:16S rRNA (cytidine1402-2'-O)-methyltransferase
MTELLPTALASLEQLGPRASSQSAWPRALRAANEVAGQQDYPRAALYIVATPIGNLADISLRALHVLQTADTLACEDTRHTVQMLRAIGIDASKSKLLALHQHNEEQSAQTVVERLQSGQRVAYVSDAGTPAVSDPGARLVAVVRTAGYRVIPLPGASSITALVSAAGAVATDAASSGFVFHGFLPSGTSARDALIRQISADRRATVLLEAPHRMSDTSKALSSLGGRRITVGRELSKQFEQLVSMRADGLMHWLSLDTNHLRGEFALLIHPESPRESDTQTISADGRRVLSLLLAEVPLKTAARLTSQITGDAKNALYVEALAHKEPPPRTGL